MLISDNLTDLELDGLKESMNICMGKAAFALSEIFEKRVRITIPHVLLQPTQKLREDLETCDKMVAVSISIVGDAKGDLVLFFGKPDALSLANLLQGDVGGSETTQVLDELKKSVLTEVGNIVLSSFLNALAEFTEATFLHEVPKFHATWEEILNLSHTRILQREGEIGFLLKAQFEVDSTACGGRVFLFPDTDLLSLLLKSIRKMLG